ncbi:protein Spindly [Bicyclus anynana]|uniref:Protein Spindly n=1 Tax=Bicyclus anynana TaxID=110368 RepID=A0A6J1N4N2_BICAN|nr:protein Spindly [Bicyclus anynana]
MDYSTISNKTNITEAEDLTGGEINEKYYLLRKQYENLSSNYDAIKQELHDTRRSYQTALDVQSHLNAELESCQADELIRRNELNSRINGLQEDISALRQERTDLVEQHAKEIKVLEVENRRLREEQLVVARDSPVRDTAEFDELRAALSSVTTEAAGAKVALDEARAELVSWQIKVEELVTEVAELRAAADIRREELSAASERESAALADLAEARAMLHQVDSQDLQPHAAKGNSLFAEVEDKRQEMAKNLIQMKQTNSRLRRELANKQAELEALLHEKQTIWEQQAGAAAHYDRELIEKYEERITQLEGQCERQRRELARWFGKLCEPAAQGWLPGVLDHLKTECEQLRLEVLSRGAAQLASAAQVRELRRKIAHLTANNTKQSPIQNQVDKDDISVQKFTVQVKKIAVDDVKKKVSFN